jgi:NADPH:quinone reductase-like Zn-dependent oxidoreductase
MTMSTRSPQLTVTATEIVLPGVVEPGGLQVRQRPLPPPAAGQVLVRVEASGVSFAEQGMRRNRYPGQPKFPFVPGYDLVGVVTATGPDVDRAWTGKRVAALTKTGGWASYALIPAATLVEVPDGVDPAAAETVVVRDDLGQVLALLRDGALTAQVAARMPLTEATSAMELAESHTMVGKVILEP